MAFGAFFGIAVLTPLWLQIYMGYTAKIAGYSTVFQISLLILFQGIRMALFFVTLTGIALRCVLECEIDSAAGLMNFILTLSGGIYHIHGKYLLGE
ncbi:MAG: hypothetical protein ACSLEN_05560 [Candidatus Malihini olakiniferum]